MSDGSFDILKVEVLKWNFKRGGSEVGLGDGLVFVGVL